MSYELLTNGQMGRAERLVFDRGMPSYDVMVLAGRGVADTVAAHYPGHRVLILCGPGNNGGDGYVAARLLAERGFDVQIWSLVPPEQLKGDAKKALEDWKRPAPLFPPSHEWEGGCKEGGNTVIIDAVFGSGLARPLEEPVISVFEQIKASGCPVVAVDVPSGVNGSTGTADAHSLTADHTVTFFRKKIGHVLLPGREYCGTVHVVDIAISDDVLMESGFAAFENHPDLWRTLIRPKKAGGNKYDYGHALAYGGPRMTGASCMAAHAALRIGAGLCTIAAHPDAADVYRRYLPNIMYEPCGRAADFKSHFEDARRNALLIGPGAGLDDAADLRRGVLDVCAAARPCVLDADALSAFKDSPEQLHDALGPHCVLTPHDGEFARVFPDIKGNRLERAWGAARRTGAVILLKGADTVIAPPDGPPVINANAPPSLATAGSGDVLAGMILGLLARGLPPFEAACAATWMHGEAAARFGEGLTAPDIIEGIPPLLKEFS